MPAFLHVVAAMHQGRIVPLDADLAMAAAKLGHDLKLPLANSVILATARKYGATRGHRMRTSKD